MDVIGLLATDLNAIGKLVYNVLFKWIDGWGVSTELMGSFSITVIMFTIFLKLLTSPFDVWQKVITRKNAKKMEAMKPALEKLQKAYGNDKNTLMMKQRELYKENKYSTFGGCLPMIITLVIFMVVFSGFNSAVKYHNSVVYDELKIVYNDAAGKELQALVDSGIAVYDESGKPQPSALINPDTNAAYTKGDLEAKIKTASEAAVVAAYKPQSFFLTKNIFMPDTWSSPIPTASKFTGSGIGKLGISGTDAAEYEKVMAPLIAEYNLTDEGKKAWNGYLLLPILVIVLSFLSSKLNKPAEQPAMPGQSEEQQKQQKSQQKMLMFLMPIMMAVFAFLYSAAFTLYMFCNSLLTTIFNLVYNIVAKKKDAQEKDRLMSITVKK